MVILLVPLEVLDELVDPISEESALSLRRAGIVGVSVIYCCMIAVFAAFLNAMRYSLPVCGNL
jgi:hypothetical protein